MQRWMEGTMVATDHAIRHADGRLLHDGEPLTLGGAEAWHVERIARGDIEVDSYLRITDDELTVEPGPVP